MNRTILLESLQSSIGNGVEMSKDLNSQIPWFATSNGVIDLQTSADHRDHRYTNNHIEDQTVPNPTEKPLTNKKTNSATSKSSLKLSSSNLSSKVGEGGLPPLTDKIGRPFSTVNPCQKEEVKVPPAPKENELYGDILVIPPIRQKQQFKDEEFTIPTLKVFTNKT